jgi:hypothetical protein
MNLRENNVTRIKENNREKGKGCDAPYCKRECFKSHWFWHENQCLSEIGDLLMKRNAPPRIQYDPKVLLKGARHEKTGSPKEAAGIG